MASIKLGLFKMTNSQYQQGIAIENYEGDVSLVSARSKETGIWADWAFPQRFIDGEKVPGEKALPIKVFLGKGKTQAIETLKHFIGILENGPKEEKPDIDGYQRPEKDDIPY